MQNKTLSAMRRASLYVLNYAIDMNLNIISIRKTIETLATKIYNNLACTDNYLIQGNPIYNPQRCKFGKRPRYTPTLHDPILASYSLSLICVCLK